MALIEFSNIEIIDLDLALNIAIKNAIKVKKINPDYYEVEIENFNRLKEKLKSHKEK